MTDANLVEYGYDALRVTDSIGDVIEFGADNGYALGVLIAIFVAMVFIIVILAFIVRFGKRLLP